MEQLWTYTHIIQKDPGYFAILNFFKLTILLSVCKHKKKCHIWNTTLLNLVAMQKYYYAQYILHVKTTSGTMLLQVRQLLQH